MRATVMSFLVALLATVALPLGGAGCGAGGFDEGDAGLGGESDDARAVPPAEDEDQGVYETDDDARDVDAGPGDPPPTPADPDAGPVDGSADPDASEDDVLRRHGDASPPDPHDGR